MKRDIELERKILLKIEEVYKPGDLRIDTLEIDEEPMLKVAEHCRLLYAQGLIEKYEPSITLAGLSGFTIGDLTVKGYDMLELIRNESRWQIAKGAAEEKEVPKTLEHIARITGVLVGNAIKEISGIP